MRTKRDDEKPRTLIGWLTVPPGVVKRQLYEFAAWWTDVELKPGRYPIWMMEDGRWDRDCRVKVPATIVASYTQGHFGGVPIGTAPAPKEHPDVGRETSWSLPLKELGVARRIAGMKPPEYPRDMTLEFLPTVSATVTSRLQRLRPMRPYQPGWRMYWSSFAKVTPMKMLPPGPGRAA